MMLTLFTLNNPMIAPYMVIAATMVLSTIGAYIGFRIGFRKQVLSKAPEAMKTELRSLQDELRACYASMSDMNAEKVEAKLRIEEAGDLLARAERTLSKVEK